MPFLALAIVVVLQAPKEGQDASPDVRLLQAALEKSASSYFVGETRIKGDPADRWVTFEQWNWKSKNEKTGIGYFKGAETRGKNLEFALLATTDDKPYPKVWFRNPDKAAWEEKSFERDFYTKENLGGRIVVMKTSDLMHSVIKEVGDFVLERLKSRPGDLKRGGDPGLIRWSLLGADCQDAEKVLEPFGSFDLAKDSLAIEADVEEAGKRLLEIRISCRVISTKEKNPKEAAASCRITFQKEPLPQDRLPEDLRRVIQADK